ncbi:mechanosensitive ion channel family protein [Sphingosinicella microcystinivorans]|uniref:Mechanosensitive ion channel protein MscS n=1 Tax=Sphingosinicella microcystinivorans TaxID=335406 RepID=A0AAD1D735_SPHMI|nr:mechanosensitive ion channel family protein [Sphingosinicella microcystinivorans]RKS92072.1 miniconductance mechanosensitive channel [Sphingosinicella microcystinivorans]BBE35092.1 mechanosensitive ion channel protein MscS [Sphingosinicella microcystinivorans]
MIFAFDFAFTDQPWLQTLIGLAVLITVAALANWLSKVIVLKGLTRALALTHFGEETHTLSRIAWRLSYLVPSIIVQMGIAGVPHLSDTADTIIRNVAAAFSIMTIAMAISSSLSLLNDVYQRRDDAAERPIKGYVQVGKILVYCAAAVLVVSALMDRSPLILLSGLGALAAVLMLVFQDTILSLVASIQITSNDMLRVGDWIEMPGQNADGDVIDIALHTVKVRNWDKTITTIPTSRLIKEAFKNWRGMSESGVRRIKRALLIDQTSVRFLGAEQIERLKRTALIAPYLAEKVGEIDRWNRERNAADSVNARRLTNLGTFRHYVEAYLHAHSGIAEGQTTMVRQLDPTPTGLPLELYCFTNTTVWTDYEAIQSDIFDHLIAILPEFDLYLFQEPAGRDFAAGFRHAA